jgi:prolipoprotein diacylglyceryl transferase
MIFSLATIPSPSSGSLELFGLKLNAYGLMIALGVIVAVRIAGRRAERMGSGGVEEFSSIALWAVPAGVVGGRIYHVITDYERFQGNWGDTVKLWEGGLGIWGGITLGVVVGAWRAKKMGLDVPTIVTAAVPGIAVAQAIGRWGNWFNQELFGRPTDLPWALEVSGDVAVKAGYLPGTTFHPTFLYESIGLVVLAAVLVFVVERRVKPAPGHLLAWYVAGYTFLRFFVEGLRVDPARDVGGLRLNQVVSIVVFVAAVAWIVWSRRAKDAAPPASTVSDHE